jgi:hypothetical protein
VSAWPPLHRWRHRLAHWVRCNHLERVDWWGVPNAHHYAAWRCRHCHELEEASVIDLTVWCAERGADDLVAERMWSRL